MDEGVAASGSRSDLCGDCSCVGVTEPTSHFISYSTGELKEYIVVVSRHVQKIERAYRAAEGTSGESLF